LLRLPDVRQLLQSTPADVTAGTAPVPRLSLGLPANLTTVLLVCSQSVLSHPDLRAHLVFLVTPMVGSSGRASQLAARPHACASRIILTVLAVCSIHLSFAARVVLEAAGSTPGPTQPGGALQLPKHNGATSCEAMNLRVLSEPRFEALVAPHARAGSLHGALPAFGPRAPKDYLLRSQTSALLRQRRSKPLRHSIDNGGPRRLQQQQGGRSISRALRLDEDFDHYVGSQNG
jgi:hypothetical protein